MQQLAAVPYADRILRRNGETWPRAANPPGWAQHRLEMVDALPWFKTGQAGIHMTTPERSPNGIRVILGALLGGFGASRAYVDAEVVITSLNSDQSSNTGESTRRHEAIKNTMSLNQLIGVVFEAGSTKPTDRSGVKRSREGAAPIMPCSNMPTGDSEHKQNCWVAAYFIPTHLWPVRIPGKPGAVWMLRLEKYNLEQQSWWANPTHGVPPRDHERDYSVAATQEMCGTCNRSSPRIFEEMFACLNENCASAWTNADGTIISQDEQLTYTNDFLKERRSRPLGAVTFPAGHQHVVPDFHNWWNTAYLGPKLRDEPITEANFTRRMNDLLTGFACPYCHMLNRRIRWHEWHCRNSRCNSQGNTKFRREGAPPILSVLQASTLGSKQQSAVDFQRHDLYRRTTDLPDFTAFEFELGEECYVTFLKPKPHTNAMSGSSDDLYMQVQALAADGTLSLKRRYMHSRAGATLTSHFSANYGERYLFTARVPTTPFASAPQVIQDALGRVNAWVAPYRPADEQPANELYLAGYFQGQKMNWHDDGETGLGTVITTYTLGGQGEFKLSIKQSYNNGIRAARRTGRRPGTGPSPPLQYDPVIPGCLKYDERLLLKQQLQRGEIDQNQWAQQFRALIEGASPANRNTLLRLSVSHGDIVIMHGKMCQRYLDHCVDVTTPMRFALTFRYIAASHQDPQTIADHDQRMAYDVQFDPGDDWETLTQPQFLSPVASREGSVGEPLPAVSPREVLRDDDDDDDAPQHQRPRLDNDTDAGALSIGSPAVPLDSQDAPATSTSGRSTRQNRGASRARGRGGAGGRSRGAAPTRRSTRNRP